MEESNLYQPQCITGVTLCIYFNVKKTLKHFENYPFFVIFIISLLISWGCITAGAQAFFMNYI
jgi:hypothetical protein